MIKKHRPVRPAAHVTELEAGLAGLPDRLHPQAAPGVCAGVFRMLPAPCARVLNAGAGRGGLSLVMQRAGYDVRSVDLYPEHFVAEGLECSGADLLRPWPFPSASFEVVTAIEVIEHLEDPWRFVREALRVLVDGGVLVFTTPNVMSLASRLTYLATGKLPYFRDESFRGCYHVTPIFDWTVERFCATSNARLDARGYSRVEWPRRNDIPRWWTGRIRRGLLRLVPKGALTGELAIYRLVKDERKSAEVSVGRHTR